MKKTTPTAAFSKGDHVRHPGYKNATGIVTRSSKRFAYVEWTGFPPDVPMDGDIQHGEIRRIPSKRRKKP